MLGTLGALGVAGASSGTSKRGTLPTVGFIERRRLCQAAGDPGGAICANSAAMPAFHELRLMLVAGFSGGDWKGVHSGIRVDWARNRG